MLEPPGRWASLEVREAMDTTNRSVVTLSNNTEIRYVDAHRVVDRVQQVPGKHPDPEKRIDGQTSYTEEYVECIDCGAERLCDEDLPVECDGGRK